MRLYEVETMLNVTVHIANILLNNMYYLLQIRGYINAS